MKRRRSTSRRNRHKSLIAATGKTLWQEQSSASRPLAGGIDVQTATATQTRTVGQKKQAKTRKTKSDYIRETMRPIVCLAFVLPMLFLYEFSSIFSNQLSGKSGIDLWLHRLMDSIGAGHLVILPVLTAGVLLYQHHASNDRWQFRPSVLLGMLAESACLGFILYFAGNAVYELLAVQSQSSNPIVLAILETGDAASGSLWQSTVTYIGCGVYEELIFRLLLLSGLIRVCKAYLDEPQAKAIAMVITSLIFAALHFDIFNPAGASFDVNGFLFRFFASLIFCVLYLFRGFGVAVGTHTIYDVMTQL